MTFIERVTVSRKTARDGKLEICAEFARQLADSGSDLLVRLGDSSNIRPASVVTMPCACAGPENHVTHHFLQAEAFRALTADLGVCLKLESEEPSVIHVTADDA